VIVNTADAPTAAADGFEALCRVLPLRPIKSDGDHDRAIAQINALLDRPALTTGEADYLAVLGMIVERHESLIYGEPEDVGSGDDGEGE